TSLITFGFSFAGMPPFMRGSWPWAGALAAIASVPAIANTRWRMTLCISVRPARPTLPTRAAAPVGRLTFSMRLGRVGLRCGRLAGCRRSTRFGGRRDRARGGRRGPGAGSTRQLGFLDDQLHRLVDRETHHALSL